MYNEIVAAGIKIINKHIHSTDRPLIIYIYIHPGVQYHFDDETKTAIGYLPTDSSDGWTKAGTWFTFNDKSSIAAISKYIS